MMEKKNRGYFASVVSCRCPRCREGKLFKNKLSISPKKNLEMNKECPVCGQATEIEVGFYYGTSYVSYALSVALSVASLIAWWLVVGLSIYGNSIFYWVLFNAVFLLCMQPSLMRFSRSVWISWFVRYDPNWQQNKPEDVSERMNTDQGGNW